MAALLSPEPQTLRAAWTAMALTGWWAIVPLAIAALLTGVVMSLGTPWGLFRHYWVLIALLQTIACTAVLLLHMPSVSATAALDQSLDRADLRGRGGDLLHPSAGLLVLLVITALNVFKPSGLTPYGWRTQRQALHHGPRRAMAPVAPRPVPGAEAHQPMRLPAVAAGVGSFVCALAEMWLVMLPGMLAFMLLRPALLAGGFTALLDPASVAFEVGMGTSMVAPMLLWMRIRGCGWREAAEMGAGMLLPVAAILLLRGLGLGDWLPWLANAEHPAMLLGMLGVMLYRWPRVTRRHAFGRWPAAGQSSAPARMS